MNTNIRRLGIFFLVAFAIIVADVTYWQVIDAANLSARADNPRLRLQAATVRRGLILDRHGALLAGRTIDSQGYVHRVYQDPSLSHLIGYDSPRFGKSELERTYDSFLTGQETGTNWRGLLDQWEHKTVVGNNLTLSIDDSLQTLIAAILPDRPSAAIVADPRNGNILAMVSKPGFDANQINNPDYWSGLLHNGDDPLINRAVNGFYPPGSTFKVLTLAAVLDSGTMSLDTRFSGLDATGPLTVNGHIFPAAINNLPAGYTSVDLRQALMFSDNIVFAKAGLALGAGRFLDYARRFGIDQSVPFDIPVSLSHMRSSSSPFAAVDLASSAFGQGALHLTPLQMLMVDESVANDGTIPRPVLVQRVTSPDGTVIKSADRGTLYQPISATAAHQVRDAMVDVVRAGSGYLAQIPGTTVAGKTGTAETGDGRPPHSWFISFAPAEAPRIAVVVLVEHGGEGFSVAAPLAKQIMQAALAANP